jgi:hypothetical protein
MIVHTPPEHRDAAPTPTAPLPHTGLQVRLRRIAEMVRAYPIPSGAILLMLVSLGLWLTRHADLAQWPLLVVVLVVFIRNGRAVAGADASHLALPRDRTLAHQPHVALSNNTCCTFLAVRMVC